MSAPAQLPVCFDPPSNGVSTSDQAAESMKPHVDRLAALVLAAIRQQPRTCDQLEHDLDMRHSTCSARITRLHTVGLIVDSGERLPTRSGRAAIVWEINETITKENE